MISNVYKLLQITTVSLLLAACGPKMTTIRNHAAYEKTITSSKNFVVLPPTVEVNLVDASGQFKRQHSYEYQLEDVIIDVLSEKLRQKNYAIKPASRRMIHDLKASKNILAFRENFQEKINKLYVKALWPEEQAFAIEEEVNGEIKDFRERTKADLIVFVEYFGKFKTKGASTKSIAGDIALAMLGVRKAYKPEDDPEYIEIRVALVDAKDYRILWSNKYGKGYSSWFRKDIEKEDRKRLHQIFDVMLSSIPSK